MARKPHSELQIGEGSHDTFVRVQRIAWVALALAVLAVLLGVFGGQGPVSDARQRTADGVLEIRYDRLTRWSAPATLEITVSGEHVDANELRLGLNREYLKAALIERITPAPVRTQAGTGEIYFVFAAAPGARALIVFHLKMEAIGLQRGRITLAPDTTLEFAQFVYP